MVIRILHYMGGIIVGNDGAWGVLIRPADNFIDRTSNA